MTTVHTLMQRERTRRIDMIGMLTLEQALTTTTTMTSTTITTTVATGAAAAKVASYLISRAAARQVGPIAKEEGGRATLSGAFLKVRASALPHLDKIEEGTGVSSGARLPVAYVCSARCYLFGSPEVPVGNGKVTAACKACKWTAEMPKAFRMRAHALSCSGLSEEQKDEIRALQEQAQMIKAHRHSMAHPDSAEHHDEDHFDDEGHSGTEVPVAHSPKKKSKTGATGAGTGPAGQTSKATSDVGTYHGTASDGHQTDSAPQDHARDYTESGKANIAVTATAPSVDWSSEGRFVVHRSLTSFSCR